MRIRAQQFATYVFNELWRGVDIKSRNAKFWKLGREFHKTRCASLNDPEDFLHSARNSYFRRGVEYALFALEMGLKKFPNDEALLGEYLRFCSEQERFARIVNFINPANRQLYDALIRFQFPEPNPQSKNDCQKHALVWLTEIVINKNFEDVLALWQLADLLEHAGKTVVAKEIYKKLSKKTTNTANDYLYAGLSKTRLGNIEAGFVKLEQGLTAYPQHESIKTGFRQLCFIHYEFNRYLRLENVDDADETVKAAVIQKFFREIFRETAPETFLLKLQEIQLNCGIDDFRSLMHEFLIHMSNTEISIASAKSTILFSKILDIDAEFGGKIFSVLHSKNWGEGDEIEKYLLELIYKITPPITPHGTSDLEGVFTKLLADAQELSGKSMVLTEPNYDMGRNWYPWQGLFCLAQPHLYHRAISAFQALAFKLWPKLDYTAPHTRRPPVRQDMPGKKIRIGFTVLDSMPMMSGFMGLLDKNVFETVFLRPGVSGESTVANDWIARADITVEYSDTDTYSAAQTIANQELDILISGPSVPQIFFPLMGRVAHLQMVLLEPNWLDGIGTNDYYISWKPAEPEDYGKFYRTKVSLLNNPPYWIEKSSLGSEGIISDDCANDIRQRLLGIGSNERFYICANTPPKIHPSMDDILLKILEMDPDGYLVLLRKDHAIAQPLKVRLRDKLGKNFERVIFLNTLKRNDAHSLLSSADCCLDSYPIGGMSSSFDGLILGVPIVTLPADIPFGRWTAAIYEYIGVSGLTAQNADEYVAIALRLAHDKSWRMEKSAELREKSPRYVESKASFDEFQHFLLEAWRRKQAGLAPGNWVAGEWR